MTGTRAGIAGFAEAGAPERDGAHSGIGISFIFLGTW